MKNVQKKMAIILVFVMLVTPVFVDAASYSLVTTVSPNNGTTYGAMDGCATDGSGHIYVLKHNGDSNKYVIVSYNTTGTELDILFSTAKDMNHPNGLTYYQGHLYIATMKADYVIRVKVTATSGEFDGVPERVQFTPTKTIAKVGAITHYTNNRFIIRGEGNNFAVYYLDGNIFKFEKALGIDINVPGTINDIFYNPSGTMLYVTSWDGGSGSKLYGYKVANPLTRNTIISYTGSGKFEIEGGCIVGSTIYFVTNNESALNDGLYK